MFIAVPLLILGLDSNVATVDAGKIVFDIDFLKIHLECCYLCASGWLWCEWRLFKYFKNNDFSPEEFMLKWGIPVEHAGSMVNKQQH